jgi:hypothetical protein
VSYRHTVFDHADIHDFTQPYVRNINHNAQKGVEHKRKPGPVPRPYYEVECNCAKHACETGNTQTPDVYVLTAWKQNMMFLENPNWNEEDN